MTGGTVGKISFKAVAIGNLVDLVTSVILGVPFALYAISKLDVSGMGDGQVMAMMGSAIRANIPLYLSKEFVGLLCSIFGGYVAARIAGHDEVINGCLSALLGIAVAIYTMVWSNTSDPLWLQSFVLIVNVAAAALGGDLRRRQVRRRLRGV